MLAPESLPSSTQMSVSLQPIPAQSHDPSSIVDRLSPSHYPMTSRFSDMSSWKPSLHFSHSSLPGFSFPQAPSPTTSNANANVIADPAPKATLDEVRGLAGIDDAEKLPPPPLLKPPAGRRGHTHRRSAAKTGIDFDAIARAKSSHSADQEQRPSLHQRRRSQSGPPMLTGRDWSMSATNESPSSVVSPSKPTAFRKPTSPIPIASPEKSTSPCRDKLESSTKTPKDTENPLAVSEDAKAGRRKSSNSVVDILKSVGRTASTMLDATPASQKPKSATATATSTPPSKKQLLAKRPPSPERVAARLLEYQADAAVKEDAREHDDQSKAPQKRGNKKKPKKTRPWAGIITRKSKKKGKSVKKSASKASLQRASSIDLSAPVEEEKGENNDNTDQKEDDVGEDADEDERLDFSNMDGIVVLQSPSDPGEDEPDDLLQDTFEEAWKPLSFYEQGRQLEKDAKASLDYSSPILDLDAALGPFNTPDTLSISIDSVTDTDDVNGGIGAGLEATRPTPLRRMYSSTRSHRRSESMPIISTPSTALRRSSFYAFAQAAASTEVFDETEEDAFWANAN